MGGRKNKVAYFYDDAYAELYYGSNHPMKPLRMAMTHHLVLGYGLHEKLDVYEPRPAEKQDLVRFHEEDYIQFLSTITPTRATEHINDLRRFNLGEGDCPIFDDMWRFCRLYAGASVEAAKKLNHGLYDIAINWAGGLHHAKKAEASGFCYVNDLVLAILELLKYHPRVLYIDVDIHHGDGVEEAFYLTDRVMTVSFHKYGMDFFPGTGALRDIGERRGRFYAVNVPLKDGTTDANFLRLFKPIMQKVMDVFRPQAIVMQCGADCLAKDRIGMWNMSLKGHAEAVKFMKGFGVPMLVTGGGGYTKTNVAKCWTYETAVLTNQDIDDELPETAYHQYFAPDFNLQVNEHGAIENQNKTQELEQILEEVLRNLSDLEFAPGVQFSEAPPDTYLPEYDLDHEQDTVARLSTFCREHQFIKVDDDTTNRHSLADY